MLLQINHKFMIKNMVCK